MSLVSSLFSRSARTLSVSSDCIPVVAGQPILEPVSLCGTEGINGLFDYALRLKTPDNLNVGIRTSADFDLDEFLGHEISCRIELDGKGVTFGGGGTGHLGGGTRWIHAIVTEAFQVGPQGRHITYELTLRPWLHLATQRADCKIYQNKNVVEIIDDLLARYPFPVDKRLYGPVVIPGVHYPVRDFQTQFNESDFAFFERLCQEWGINYFFEHDQATHRLVLADHISVHKPNPSEAYQEVDYRAPGWKTDAEYIHDFALHHRLTSGRYTASEYDYTRPLADLRTTAEEARPTRHADSEIHEWHAERAGSHYAQPEAGTAGPNDPQQQGRALTRLRAQALRTRGVTAKASGHLRGMVPGCTFRLQNHPRSAANIEYLVLDTRLAIEDVGQDSQGTDSAQRWRVQVDFSAHPTNETLRPFPSRLKPRAGSLPATVVGPTGQNIWTDRYGRIKVQLPWDRVGNKDQDASCWIRVCSSWAGNQFGAMHLPRIGQEVTIDFYGGDPDLPYCTGRAPNALNLPPWALPAQSALSGWRSRELVEGGGNYARGRSNHLLLDDSAGAIQAQLKSDHRSSSLSLGYITRVDDHAGRKDARGDGFELRSDAHGAVRAAHGLLISTQGRPNAEHHITDMPETVLRLTQACQAREALGHAALEAKAHDIDDQDPVSKALGEQIRTLRGETQATESLKSGRCPELTEPHLVIASAAGIQTSSLLSTHLQAGEHLASTSGGHTSLCAGRSFLASAKEAIRFFSYKAGMRLIAFGGDIEIKSLKNSIEVMAQLQITQTAESISITARKELKLNGGGSYFKLDASGIEGGTQGLHRVHAGKHNLVGPKNAATAPLEASAKLRELPEVLSFNLRSHADDGRAYAMEPYTLYKNGAVIRQGVTDAHGTVLIDKHQPGSGSYKVRLLNGHEIELPVNPCLESTDAKLAAEGFRSDDADADARLRHLKHFRGDKEAD